MPTLVLSHRYSPDSNALFAAPLAAGWDVERLRSFRCPDGLATRDPVFYGETILADAIAEDLGKEPGARYESAKALADDLQRYLDGEPVSARRAGFRYRLTKRAKKR